MKFPIFNLILTVFLFWLTIQIESSYEVYLSYIFILSIGIIHGSNDISLIKILRKNQTLTKKYLAVYVALILFNITAFIVWPLIALLFFVIISCYHFGEQHFHSQIKTQNLYSRGLFLSYGILIFGLLFNFNSLDTSIIIEELTGFKFKESHFLWFLITGIISTVVFFILNIRNYKKELSYFQEIFLLLLFALLFNLAQLLWAFAIYFTVWHSIPSLLDQIKEIYGVSNKLNFIQYMKSSFAYWLISIVGLIILYYSTVYLKINFVTIFFAFLAAITVPHVIVMYFLNKN